MFKIGPKTRKGAGSLITEASADDPIYTREFAVGEMRSRPSSNNTAETSSPNGSKKEEPSTNLEEDLDFDIAAHKSLEESLHRLYEQHTGQRRAGQAQSSESTTPDNPEAVPAEK